MNERTHGGRREGAGRPRITTDALVPRTIRLTREEWAALDVEAARRKLTAGRLIAALVADTASTCDKAD